MDGNTPTYQAGGILSLTATTTDRVRKNGGSLNFRFSKLLRFLCAVFRTLKIVIVTDILRIENAQNIQTVGIIRGRAR